MKYFERELGRQGFNREQFQVVEKTIPRICADATRIKSVGLYRGTT